MVGYMHTNPVSAVLRLKGHRTLVALPVFVALFAYSLHQVQQIRADLLQPQGVVESGKERHVAVLPSGAQLLVQPGASFDTASGILLKGEVVVRHASLAELNAGPYLVDGWNGAFSVTVQGEKITVAALTTPVLVRDGLQRMVIPVGAQALLPQSLPALDGGWQAWAAARATLPLPVHYVRERLLMLDGLPVPALPALEEVQAALPAALDALRLPAARERAGAEREHANLDALLLALQAGDTQEVQTLLLQESVQHALAAESALPLMPDIATLALEKHLVPLFLPFILAHDAMRSLAYQHPALRDLAWVTDTGLKPNVEARAARLLAFPRGDLLPVAASPLAAGRWADAVTAYLQPQKENAPAVLDAVRRMAAAQLPERTTRYAGYLTQLAHPYRGTLSQESQELLYSIEQLPFHMSKVRFDAEIQEAAPAVQESAVSDGRVLGVIEYEGGKDAAVQMLVDAGGMQTAHTSVTAIHGQTVKVMGMLFRAKDGDESFEFTFDAGTRTVSDLRVDGKLLPYSITLEQFVTWVKGE
jgi:hypothetical protein